MSTVVVWIALLQFVLGSVQRLDNTYHGFQLNGFNAKDGLRLVANGTSRKGSVNPQGPNSLPLHDLRLTFDQLHATRLVLKYAEKFSIKGRWSLAKVELKELRGSELMVSLFVESAGQMYEIPLDGSDMIGMMWQHLWTPEEGAGDVMSTMRIDHVLRDNKTDEIYMYGISSFNWTNGEWDSVCRGRDGASMESIFLYNWNSPLALTIACKSGELAKCVELGYMPWKNATYCNHAGTCKTISMQHYHQACTRMYSADFCGDGHGFRRFLSVDIWDNLTPPIHARETQSNEDWQVEGEWNVDGAVCLTNPLLDQLPSQHCAHNFRDQRADCGTDVGSRSMLGTSFPK